MRLRFSRHAKDNMRLYGIAREEVRKAINSPDSISSEVKRQVVMKRFPGRFSGYPLKVVFARDNDNILVVTSYPLKSARWRERG